MPSIPQLLTAHLVYNHMEFHRLFSSSTVSLQILFDIYHSSLDLDNTAVANTRCADQ